MIATLAKLLLVDSALLSVVAFCTYGFDKRRAEKGGRRVSERTLHLLALLGGWAGALVAMKLFRHKTRKPSFFLLTATIVALHAGLWWLLLR